MSKHKSRTRSFFEKIGVVEKDPKEQLREWTREIRKEQRLLDREIRTIEREEIKMKRDIKALAKKGEMEAVRPLATAIVRAQGTKTKILEMKAHMNSILLEMRAQNAHLRVAKTMKSSTKMMTSMNKLMMSPKMQGTFRDMAYEMEKAGIIQEVMDDAIDGAFDDTTEEVDEMVEQVIAEVTSDIMGNMAATPLTPVKQQQIAQSGKELFLEGLGPVAVGADDSSELDRRFEALRT